jgi:hypothetical protein
VNSSATSKSVGGLIGSISRDINNCYSTGSASGYQFVGGLVGENHTLITDCYSTGLVAGDSNVGGLVGNDYNGTYCIISSSYFLEVAGPNNGFGIPLTDVQMKQQSSFTAWNFNNIWAICETTNYPRLLWSIPAADFICPDGVDFVDYAFFASRWLNTNCAANDDCDGTDFDSSGTVDMADLKVFCTYWLQGL